MAPGRRRGAKGVKTTTDLTLGDLVLAKVKGFPAWPAKVSRPEDWDRAPDPKKYFVQFFGTSEIAFVAPPDIQAFTTEAKNKLSARCQGKTVKYFAQAVKEISAEFEASHRPNSSGTRDEDKAKNLASETNSIDSVANETMDTHDTDDTKPSSSDDANIGLSRSPYLGEKNKLSSNPTNPLESVPESSPSSHPPDKDEAHHDKGRDGWSDAKNELTNGHQPKVAMGQRRKHVEAMRKNSGTASSQENVIDGVPSKFSPSCNMKTSSTSKVGLDVGSNGKGKKLLKQKRHSEVVDNVQLDSEGINEVRKEVIPQKKIKLQHDQEKHVSQTNYLSSPAKMSKFSDTIDDIRLLRAQGSRKNDSKDLVHSDDKMSDTGSKRLKLSGKDEVQRLKAQKGIDASNDSANEDDFPPLKRHRCATDSSRSESYALHKNGLGNPNKILSPVVQQSTKRRAVRICDDDEDELPKTPIHGQSTNKVSDNLPVPDLKKTKVVRSQSNVNDKLILGKLGRVDNVIKKQEQSSLTSNKVSTPTPQHSAENITKEPSVSVLQMSTTTTLTDLEEKTLKDAKSSIVSPKASPVPINATRTLAEPQKKHVVKGHGSNYQKKAASVGDWGLTTTSKKSELSLNQSISERNKLSAEKRKITIKTDSHVNLVVDNPDEITSPVERLNVGIDAESSLQVNMKNVDSVVSMKHLIAAAQAKKKQANLQHLRGNSGPLLATDVDMHGQSPSLTPATLVVESSNKLHRDAQGIHSSSPVVHQLSSINEHENGELEERRLSSSHHASGSSLSGGTEAAVARDAFEGMIETLSRTKESIGRATRLAIDCAKYGIANEIVELLVRKLENEASLHRKVDLFFLVDSITQCSHGQKGVAGAAYIPMVQAALPRLIGAAAPPGQGALENRRQCHKVLRLWVERKILPESVLRRFMDDMGAKNDDTSSGHSLRRPSRAERAIDDPIREMEGMLVDEYGSNATFQLPGFLARNVFEEEEDEDNFPTSLSKDVAETPLSKHTASSDPESCSVSPMDGRHCILEDVDGELEMEDVSGSQKVENSVPDRRTSDVTSVNPMSIVNFESALQTSELLPSPESTPPLPPGSPPLTPPLPTSPPPLSSKPPLPPPPSAPPPPPPPSSPPPLPPPPSSQQHLALLLPGGPPQLLSNQSLPPQSTLVSQCMPPQPPTVSSSQPLAYCPTPLPHEIGGATSGNHDAHMVSNMDSPASGEVFPQQSSFFPPAAVSNARENTGYNSTRLLEHGQGDTYITSQASQLRQSHVPGSGEPFAQRPLHLEPPPQRTTSHFSYPNSVQQHQYAPYSLANFADCPRRYVGVNTGYFGTPERPPMSSINFAPSAANSVPVATPVPGDVSGNGAPMMPFKPDVSSINWRPAMHE